MSPRPGLLERRPLYGANRLATWLWALYRFAQPFRTRVPIDELLGRVRELIRVVESLLYVAPRDLELLARLGWELNKEVCASVEIAERQPDASVLLTDLEDLQQAAEAVQRQAVVQILAQLVTSGRLLQLHAVQEVREVAARWLVRDLHARLPCVDLLQFCLQLGISQVEILTKVERIEAALRREVNHARV